MNRHLSAQDILPRFTLAARSGATSSATPTVSVTTTAAVAVAVWPFVGGSGTPTLGEWQSARNTTAGVAEISSKAVNEYNWRRMPAALVEGCPHIGSHQPWWSRWKASDGSGSFFPASNSRFNVWLSRRNGCSDGRRGPINDDLAPSNIRKL